MPKGIYAAASAMVVETRTLDIAARNLSQAQTPGYKRQVALRDAFAESLANQGRQGDISADGGAGIFPSGTYHSLQEGTREQTGATFDLALQNAPPRLNAEGQLQAAPIPFYQIRDTKGQALLTRAAHFDVDESGRLMTAEGFAVQGQSGDISIPADALQVTVDVQGRVYARVPGPDGGTTSFVDQLRIVTVENPTQMAARSGQYFDPGTQTPVDSSGHSVHQGWLERSNVDSIGELVSMISIQRRYEAAQRALKQQASTGGGLSDMLRGA